MPILFAWLGSRLSGIVAQATGIVLVAVFVFGGLGLGFWWLREDARNDERNKLQTAMANARIQQLLLRQRAEHQAMAIGSRAEKDLLQELDVSDKINNELEKKLADTKAKCDPIGRPVCYPKNVVGELNK